MLWGGAMSHVASCSVMFTCSMSVHVLLAAGYRVPMGSIELARLWSLCNV